MSAGRQLVASLIMEWEPHIEPADQIDAESVRFVVFRLCDEAFDGLVEAGMEPDEAATTTRIVLGSS